MRKVNAEEARRQGSGRGGRTVACTSLLLSDIGSFASRRGTFRCNVKKVTASVFIFNFFKAAKNRVSVFEDSSPRVSPRHEIKRHHGGLKHVKYEQFEIQLFIELMPAGFLFVFNWLVE